MSSKSEYHALKKMMSARYLQDRPPMTALRSPWALSAAAALSRPETNIHAVGMGPKIVHGKLVDQMAIRFYVTNKVAASMLGADRIPDSVDGLPTDVIESPPAFLAGDGTLTAVASCTTERRKKQRPYRAGISAGHFQVSAGTIGCFCRSRLAAQANRVYALSNNHVFANVNQGGIGDDVYQPGQLDGGRPADRIGLLERFVKIHLGGSTPNRVGVAIAQVDDNFVNEICEIGSITATATAVEQMEVMKHGRTTGYTEGFVTDTAYDAIVGMDHNDPSVTAFFEDQIRVEPGAGFSVFIKGGDSGSLLVAKEPEAAVGLIFAGPADGGYGLANPIKEVMDGLQIDLV